MRTNWDRKIWHIHRKVKPTAFGRLGLRGQLLKAKVKRRKGLPSRNLPLELVLERLGIEFADEPGGLDPVERLRRLDWKKLRERLLERKRRERNAARRRARPQVQDTRIYLWRRRQEWLRRVEGSQADAVEHGRLASPPLVESPA
jgi:hypothetical protein